MIMFFSLVLLCKGIFLIWIVYQIAEKQRENEIIEARREYFELGIERGRRIERGEEK